MHEMTKHTLVVFFIYFIVETDVKFTQLDKSKFQAGKTEYELIHQKSQLPDYGKCWKDTIISLNRDCQQITAELQGKLALAYLNCFLEMQGLATYNCDFSRKLSVCTEKIKESDRNSLATFFTHTQNICYFLESQVWHDQTEQTIGKLASSSQNVASMLEEASELQNEMIQQQKESIVKQKESLDQQLKMKEVITSSTNNIHKMFDEFKNATSEQRHLITDLFDKVSHLQSMVLGEFSSFYSFFYYTIMLLMSYLLTSTPRTSSARFWLFGIATVNILSERFAISWVSIALNRHQLTENGSNENVYMYQWLCRKISGVTALFVLGVSAYFYQDLNVINNQLLQDIKRQNLELRNVLLGNRSKESNQTEDNQMLEDGNITLSGETQTAAADTTGYESDSALSGCSKSSESSTLSLETDHTYVPSSLSTVDSYSTCFSWHSRQTTLTDELNDLRGATPLKELAQQIDSWAKTGNYRSSSPISAMELRIADTTVTNDSRPITPRPSTSQQRSPTHYYLRSRTPVKENKTIMSETPESFSKTVKALEKITKKNSRLTRYTLQRKHNSRSSSGS